MGVPRATGAGVRDNRSAPKDSLAKLRHHAAQERPQGRRRRAQGGRAIRACQEQPEDGCARRSPRPPAHQVARYTSPRELPLAASTAVRRKTRRCRFVTAEGSAPPRRDRGPAQRGQVLVVQHHDRSAGRRRELSVLHHRPHHRAVRARLCCSALPTIPHRLEGNESIPLYD